MQQPTLRDRFAMAALTGSLADDAEIPVHNAPVVARWCYAIADAMLAARATPAQGGSDAT
jgi:hypothetical protein